PRMLGDHDEGGARHRTLDSEPDREALDEAGLARPEVAAEGEHGPRRRAPRDARGERASRLDALARDRDRDTRRAQTCGRKVDRTAFGLWAHWAVTIAPRLDRTAGSLLASPLPD